MVHACGDAEDAVVKEKFRVRMDIIGGAQLLPYVFEEPRAHAAAQDVRKHLERIPPLVKDIKRAEPEHQMPLVGFLVLYEESWP